MALGAAVADPHWPRRLSAVPGLYALLGGAISFGGWALDVPRLTDWVDNDVSIQPNAAVLITLAGAAVLLLRCGRRRAATALGGLVALAGGLTLLQYVVGADFGFNHQLLFGRTWGQDTTLTPGRVGPPASTSFALVGTALVMLGLRGPRGVRARRLVPGMALAVAFLMLFSLAGYLFGARNFYSIPWLSAISLQTATMLLALAAGLIVCVPERQPMLLLCERSSAGAMARTVLPLLVVMIPSVIWLRTKGHELNLYDLGTSRALGAVALVLGTVALMWTALLALRRREQREREADQRKDEFLATLAHELRNPLAPIRNSVQILTATGPADPALRTALAMIERQVGQMALLIDDLLDISRITLGKMELKRGQVELAAVVGQAVELAHPLIKAAGHHLTAALPSEPVYLEADPTRLAQVFANLLTNAAKYTPNGGRIDLAAARERGEVAVAVRDTGIGIDAEHLPRVFEKFAQVAPALERSQGGLGIGLALVRGLVEMHGGSVTAHSGGLGQGSEFVVRLPIRLDLEVTTPPADDAGAGGAKAEGSTAARRVLVVDDNRDAADSLAVLLEMVGHTVETANDGLEGVAAAERFRPDVVILDIGMPQLNGYDAARRIRQEPWGKDVVLVALTGWGSEADRQLTKEAGFDRHLTKPVDPATLTRLIAGLEPRPT